MHVHNTCSYKVAKETQVHVSSSVCTYMYLVSLQGAVDHVGRLLTNWLDDGMSYGVVGLLRALPTSVLVVHRGLGLGNDGLRV